MIEALSKEERSLIKEKTAKKGEILYFEGDVCDSVFVLKAGEIKIVSYGMNGQEIVYNWIHPGDVFGNNLVFSSSPRFRGNVIADKDSVLYVIPKENLIHLLQGNRAFLESYLEIQSDFGKSLNEKIKILSMPSAEERLMFYLSQRDGKIIYHSISGLAESLFLKRETLSRLVHRLAEEGQIVWNKKEIRLAKQ